MSKMIDRRVDILTGADDLEDLQPMRNFPVFIGTTSEKQESDLVHDMMWTISRSTGMIQLRSLLPLDVLYPEQTTTAAVGPTWMKHHAEFAAFLESCNPGSVLEIGGAHGILSVEHGRIRSVPWTIIEPNPSPAPECQAKFIKSFFDKDLCIEEDFDTVVHSHVLEHMYDPMRFMNELSARMQVGSRMVISIPNMLDWFTKKYTNCINFEHTALITEHHLEFILTHNELRIERKQNYGDGHSIFVCAVKDPTVRKSKIPHELYHEQKDLYQEYMRHFENQVKSLNKKIVDAKGNVFLFGAHIFSQSLISFGLDSSKISAVLDNDKNKNGKRLYGTNLMVRIPDTIASEKSPTLIVRAGLYSSEIRDQIIRTINAESVFI